MSTQSENIVDIGRQVIDALQDDLVSAAELGQIAGDLLKVKFNNPELIAQVIRHLLTEGVEIGNARNIDGKCVKFVAWKGSVGDRCERALRQVQSSGEHDRP